MAGSKSQTLEQTITDLPYPERLPLALPLAHLTIAKWFKSVVDAGEIEPRWCDVFNEKLVYLSYGGVLYRTTKQPTKDASILPIVFVFSPLLLKDVDRYYPFDTGALAKPYYGKWAAKLGPHAEEFRISGKGDHDVPSRLIHHLYGSNRQYLRGIVDPALKGKPDPLPELLNFLSADLTPNDVDDRQMAIEAQCTKPVPLDRLEWVGYPERLADVFEPLFRKIYESTKPQVPKFHMYESHIILTPNEIAAQLRSEAHQEIVKKYVNLPGEK